MSFFISFSMYFLSFVPLWITVLFIDIKSLVYGGGDKWTEIISITGILFGLLVSMIILFAKFYMGDDEKYTLRLQDSKESKTITAEFLLSYILPLFAFDFTLWDEVMHYRMYDCSLINADGKEVERTVISKNMLTTSKGKDVQVKILNNEYYLDLYDKRK